MTKYLFKIFTLSGLVPATILLGYTLLLLPNIVSNISLNIRQITLSLSLIFGLCGYIGLYFSLAPKFENKYLLKFIFLILGIVGWTIFTSVEFGRRGWAWILQVEEFNEWIIFVWPAIVALVLAMWNGRKLFQR
jgi:hypothetical protein